MEETVSKRTIFFAVSMMIVLFLIVIQSVLASLFFNSNYMPDLSLIIILYISVNFGKNIGQVMGFSSGLVLDSLSGVPFGLNSMVKLIIGYLLGFMEGKVFFDSIILPVVMITVATIFKYLLYYVVSIVFSISIDLNFFTYKYLIELFLNIVLSPVIFLLFNILSKKLYPVRDRS